MLPTQKSKLIALGRVVLRRLVEMEPSILRELLSTHK